MLSTIEQFSDASKSNCLARLTMFNTLAQVAFNGVTEMVELNLGMAKASVAESTVFAQQLLSAKDAEEFCSLTAAHPQAIGEKMLSYGQRLASIGSAMQAEFSKTIQATTAETQRSAMVLAEEVFKKTPEASDSAVSLVKSVIGNATAGFELLNKGTQQAFGVLNSHPAATAKQAPKVSKAA